MGYNSTEAINVWGPYAIMQTHWWKHSNKFQHKRQCQTVGKQRILKGMAHICAVKKCATKKVAKMVQKVHKKGWEMKADPSAGNWTVCKPHTLPLYLKVYSVVVMSL